MRGTAIALRLLGIGWFVAFCISGGGIGGFWLDRWLGLSPLFTLLGLVAGVALAVTGMYRMLMAVLSESQRSTDERKK